MTGASSLQQSRHRQKFANGEIHDWYRMVHGYSDQLVSEVLHEFEVDHTQVVLDPFCGAGTTIVECQKRGLVSVGLDANPVACFATKVKTNWRLKAERLIDLLAVVSNNYDLCIRKSSHEDPTHTYLVESGMIDRGWISPEPLRKALAIKSGIKMTRTNGSYRNALMLALVDEVVRGASNVKFGPELFCGPSKEDVDVFEGFSARVRRMAKDLESVESPCLRPKVILGDARLVREELKGCVPRGGFGAVVCSPPYPAEHDYTRNTRLELAFLEFVTDRATLRRYKQLQLRCNTKGIYSTDYDRIHIKHNESVARLATRINRQAKDKSHGFARLYSRVVEEYFGGMQRHLRSLRPLLSTNARLAYVVGDQAAYAGVCIPTAKVLASIAEPLGYRIDGIRCWRERRSTKTSRLLAENILIMHRS